MKPHHFSLFLVNFFLCCFVCLNTLPHHHRVNFCCFFLPKCISNWSTFISPSFTLLQDILSQVDQCIVSYLTSWLQCILPWHSDSTLLFKTQIGLTLLPSLTPFKDPATLRRKPTIPSMAKCLTRPEPHLLLHPLLKLVFPLLPFSSYSDLLSFLHNSKFFLFLKNFLLTAHNILNIPTSAFQMACFSLFLRPSLKIKF